MAKFRKLTTSHSERFLGSFDYNQSSVTVIGSSELREDEVWAMVDDHSGNGDWSSRASNDSNGSFNSSYTLRHAPPRTEHRRRRQIGGLSLTFDDSSNSPSPRIVHQFRSQDSPSQSPRHVATSAPVNVPDWSKIYRVNSIESLPDSDDWNDNDSELVPPHEYLARSRRMAANSVFEGVGRTLKGRDLSRVRDAVWSQTGFDG